MFTALSEQLTGVLSRLRGRGVLSESDVTDALREIRRHMLEADVSFEVTRGFVERVRERAVGALQVKAVSPGQQVVKLVHDELARMRSEEHTSELQSLAYLVCRLLLEKKKNKESHVVANWELDARWLAAVETDKCQVVL